MVREMVFAASTRMSVKVTVVGNSPMRIPPIVKFATMITVPGGMDEADHYIAANVQPGDLVITSDVPLAARIVEAQGVALSARGEIFDAASISDKLSMRNLMTELRSGGEIRGGPPSFGPSDKKKFADSFDRTLTRLVFLSKK